MLSGRRSELAAKRRRTRARDSGSSSNGESSSIDRTSRHPPSQQQQQTQQQQRPASPPPVNPLPPINPVSARATTIAPARQSRPPDSGDQIAPTSPSSRTPRRAAGVTDPLQVAPCSQIYSKAYGLHNAPSVQFIGLPKRSLQIVQHRFYLVIICKVF